MPYRRLPNTDTARLKALKTAFELSENTQKETQVFSSAILVRIKAFLPVFEQAMIVQKELAEKKVTRNRQYNELYRKARLYISHFLQVVNLCIARGELAPSIRKYYGFTEHYSKVPQMASEAEVLSLGDAVIKGEAARMAKGGTIITNPTIALVKVHYEKFKDSFHLQKDLKKIHSRALTRIADHRTEADEIILELWNEIEKSFFHLPEEERRDKCSTFGVVYFERKPARQEAGSLNEKRRKKLSQGGKKTIQDPLQFNLFPSHNSFPN